MFDGNNFLIVMYRSVYFCALFSFIRINWVVVQLLWDMYAFVIHL